MSKAPKTFGEMLAGGRDENVQVVQSTTKETGLLRLLLANVSGEENGQA
jgi:hypothetical protein